MSTYAREVQNTPAHTKQQALPRQINKSPTPRPKSSSKTYVQLYHKIRANLLKKFREVYGLRSTGQIIYNACSNTSNGYKLINLNHGQWERFYVIWFRNG